MPNQSLLYTGRCTALNQLNEMMHIARELCGGQIWVTPNAATFKNPDTGKWMEKFYTINDIWKSEDRRKLLAYARDLLNSDYGGHRLTFQLFAQSAPFAQSGAVYRNFDWDATLEFVQKSAGLSDNVFKPNKIRKDLLDYLPSYMIPRKINIFNSLPKNSNGKLDRAKIKKSN